MVRARSLITGFLLFLPLLALAAPPRVRVGDTLEARIESPHPLAAGFWRQEMELPGATFIKLRLAHLRLGPTDQLLLFGGSGNQVYRHRGPLPPGTWLPAVDGSKLTLELWTGKGSVPWGLSIDQVGRGTAPLAPESTPVPESICGTTDWQDAVCYQSDAGKWAAGDAVGRLLFQEGGAWYLCTGSLVSANEHLLTNNHCISDQAGAQSLEVRWRYQYSACGSGTLGTDSVSNGANLVKTDPTLDYTLLQISPDTPAQRYGYLTLNPNVPNVGDVMWIAEHPSGGPKKFAVNSDMDGGPAEVRAVGLVGGNGDVTGGDSDIGYYADTAGGSSGSPVFDTNDAVIALHHFGLAGTTCTSTDMNQGVEMALVYPQIAPYLGQEYFAATAGADKVAGPAPLTVHFTASTAGGTAPYTYDWDFGDGTAHSAAQNPVHTYASEGTYAVTLTVQDGAAHTATDSHLSIQVQAPVTPPALSSVKKVPSPFRLKVYGANFQDGCTVKIGGVAVPLTTWKNSGLAVAKKGAALKAMLPKGQEVQITVTNPDGGVSQAVPFTR